MFSQAFFSFFSRNTPFNQEIKSTRNPITTLGFTFKYYSIQCLNWVYYHLPSVVTGYTYDTIPRLQSNSLFGHLSTVCQEGGSGLGELIDRADLVASAHPSKMCDFFIGHIHAIYIKNPYHIKKIFYENKQCIAGYDTTKLFAAIFGDGNIFDLPFSQDPDSSYQKQRHFYRSKLLVEKSLTDLLPRMQKIIAECLPSDTKEIPDIEKFCNNLAMTVVAKAQLGLIDFNNADCERLSEIIEATFPEISNPKKLLINRFIPKNKLQKILDKGFQLFLDIIKKNKESILGSENILNELCEHDSVKLESKTVIQNGITFLIVAHETTAKLMQYTLLLLAQKNNGFAIETLKKEIGDDPDRIFKREELRSFTYLYSIMRESLRLYPPVPIFKEVINKSFKLSLNENKEDRQSDVTITIPKHTMIFVSGYHTHRLHGEHFDPDNCLHEITNPHQFFPFGDSLRLCPGRLFSMQEVALTIIRFITHFEFETDLTFPFPVKKIINLRLNVGAPVALQLKNRRSPELTDAREDKPVTYRKYSH